MARIVPIEFLRQGEVGEVVCINGDERLVARLAENGLRAGSLLEVLRAGDPLLCRIERTRLSLRTDGQVEVLVYLT